MSSKSKQTTQQTQSQSYNNQNTYGYMPGAQSPDIDALRDFKFNVDPSIASAFGSAKNRIANTFNSPTGGSYSPEMRDAMLRSSYRDLGQQQAETHSGAYNATQGQQFGAKAAVASMTAPKFVQTGGSGTGTGTSSGTSTMSQPMWGDLASGAAMGAAA